MRIFQSKWSRSLFLEITLKPVCTTHTVLYNDPFYLVYFSASSSIKVKKPSVKWCSQTVLCLGTPIFPAGNNRLKEVMVGTNGKKPYPQNAVGLVYSSYHIPAYIIFNTHISYIYPSHEAPLMDLFCITFLFMALKVFFPAALLQASFITS